MNKKHLKLVGIAFAAWYVISRPDAAAQLVHSAMNNLGSAADSVSTFVNSVA